VSVHCKTPVALFDKRRLPLNQAQELMRATKIGIVTVHTIQKCVSFGKLIRKNLPSDPSTVVVQLREWNFESLGSSVSSRMTHLAFRRHVAFAGETETSCDLDLCQSLRSVALANGNIHRSCSLFARPDRIDRGGHVLPSDRQKTPGKAL
jgi:hypothetical protein